MLLHHNKNLKLADEILNIEQMKSYKEEKTYEENKALGAIKKNTKYFYKYEWRFSQVKLKIGPLLNNQGELLNDSLAMANILMEQ